MNFNKGELMKNTVKSAIVLILSVIMAMILISCTVQSEEIATESTTKSTTQPTTFGVQQKKNLDRAKKYMRDDYKTNRAATPAVEYQGYTYYGDGVIDDEFSGCIYKEDKNGSREVFIDDVCCFQMILYEHYLFYVDEETWGIYKTDLDNPGKYEKINKDCVILVDSTASTVCETVYLKNDSLVYIANIDGYPSAYSDENSVYRYDIATGETSLIESLGAGEYFVGEYGYYAEYIYDESGGEIVYYSDSGEVLKDDKFSKDDKGFYLYPGENVYEDDNYIIVEEQEVNSTEEYDEQTFVRTLYNKKTGNAQIVDGSSSVGIVGSRIYTVFYDVPEDYNPESTTENQIITIKSAVYDLKV